MRSGIRRLTLAVTLVAGLTSGISTTASAEDWRPVPQSCVSADGTGGQCSTLRAGGGLWNLAVGPDGSMAYGTAWSSSAIVIFDRNVSTGQLTQRAGTAGCASEDGSSGQCLDVRAIGLADAVAISGDGKQVYVGGWSGGIAVFDRNTATGALTQKAGTAGCFTADGSLNGVAGACSTARGWARRRISPSAGWCEPLCRRELDRRVQPQSDDGCADPAGRNSRLHRRGIRERLHRGQRDVFSTASSRSRQMAGRFTSRMTVGVSQYSTAIRAPAHSRRRRESRVASPRTEVAGSARRSPSSEAPSPRVPRLTAV